MISFGVYKCGYVLWQRCSSFTKEALLLLPIKKYVYQRLLRYTVLLHLPILIHESKLQHAIAYSKNIERPCL